MAAYVANTQADTGEEGSGSSVTLKEYLSDLPNVYAKLEQQGVTELDILIYMNEEDLKALCGKDGINLTVMEAIKFKSLVRKLQAQLKPKESTHIVAVTMNEQKEFDKIKLATQQANDVQTIFENHFNEVEDHVVAMTSSVDQQVKNIINILQKRQQSLYTQIEKWKINKLESINQNVSAIVKYQNELKSAKNECDRLLKNNNDTVKDRANKIKQITRHVFENNKSFQRFEQYIVQHTKMMNIKFDSNTRISGMAQYGAFEKNCDSSLVSIAKIVLKAPIKINDVDNGYKVQLKWQTSKEQKNKTDFTVRFKKVNGDDEKKIDDEWLIAEHQQIRSKNDNKFEVDIDNIFECGTRYNYDVELKISKPMRMLVRSNIVCLMIDINKPPKGNVVTIQLQEYKHNAHNTSHRPGNMLSSNDQLYGSKVCNLFGSNEIDWVIFKIQQNELYLPTKFQIKNRFKNNTWDGMNVKTMRIFIGDENNKWFSFNPNTINVAKHGDYQSFDIDGVDHKVIKQNKLRYIKLEFITNHGMNSGSGCKFVVKEIQLYGIKST